MEKTSNKIIYILGCGALGSNIAMQLAYDTKMYELYLLDKDRVEPRNYQFGTQQYFREQQGMTKVIALQLNIYKATGRKVIPDYRTLTRNLTFPKDTLLIDCFDNYDSRKAVKEIAEVLELDCLHVGFSPSMTFEASWNENYTVPDDVHTDFDICEAEGAKSFIQGCAGIAGNVIIEYLNKKNKIEVVGNKFNVTKIV